MALSPDIEDREYQKFDVNDAGQTIVRTSAVGTFTPQGLQNAGEFQLFEVSNTEWRQLPILAGRNAINIQNEGTAKIKIRYDDGGGVFEGMTIFANGGERQYAIQGPIDLWVKSESGVFDINIEQIS